MEDFKLLTDEERLDYIRSKHPELNQLIDAFDLDIDLDTDFTNQNERKEYD